MANNIIKCKSGSQTIAKIMKKIAISTGGSGAAINTLKKQCWYSDGMPVVDANSHETYPAVIGNLAYDYTNDDSYICTVTPTASTAATFVKINA